MQNTYKAFKFQLKYCSVYTVILLLVILFNLILASGILIFVKEQSAGSEVFTGQIDVQTYVIIFILGLLSFKASFKFMLANGFSRRCFFRANLAALAVVAFAWTLIVISLAAVYKAIAPYKLLHELIYNDIGAAAGIFWLCAALFLSAALGWGISLVYYRCDSRGKVVVSVVPFVIPAAIAIIDPHIGGAIFRGLGRFFLAAMGLSTATPNPYLGAFSMLLFAVLLCGCNYLLIRRAQLKD